MSEKLIFTRLLLIYIIYIISIYYINLRHFFCFAVAKWSKVLASFFCVCSRDSLVLSQATAYIGRQQHSLCMAVLDMGRNTISCSVWVDSAYNMNLDVVNE